MADAIHPVRLRLAEEQGGRRPTTGASDVGRFEGKGKQSRAPTIEYVEAAAEVFGVPLQELLPLPEKEGPRTRGGAHLLRLRRRPDEEIEEWLESRARAEQRVRGRISAAIGAANRRRGSEVSAALADLFWQSGTFIAPAVPDAELEEWVRYLELLRKPPGTRFHALRENKPRLPDHEWETIWDLQVIALRRLLQHTYGWMAAATQVAGRHVHQEVHRLKQHGEPADSGGGQEH